MNIATTSLSQHLVAPDRKESPVRRRAIYHYVCFIALLAVSQLSVPELDAQSATGDIRVRSWTRRALCFPV
jgi:hypothetical protein